MHDSNDRWLLGRAATVTSQNGEDGIIEAALDRLPTRDRWCVEVGAGDGVALSNTWNLVQRHGYGAVLIEADAQRFAALAGAHRGIPRVIRLQRRVGFDADDSLDALLADTPVPRDFDLLSVDIDGNDYHVWDAVRHYRPKLVVIEFNPTVPIGVPFVQVRRHGVQHGASAASLIQLASRKGYALVAATVVNAVFVDARYFSAFGIADNSEATLRVDLSWVTHIFSGYDGRVFLQGAQRLPWHELPLSAARVQQLPCWLRAWPEDYGPARRLALHVYRHLRRRRWR